LTLVRVYGASREQVFRALTDCALLAQWWGPRRFTNPVCELDPRPGGAIRVEMEGPDGQRYPMKGVFREVVAPERVVTDTSAFADEKGEPQLEVVTTQSLAEQGGVTRLTIEARVVKATPEMEQGWSESLFKLGEVLDKLRA
jgi:uncharacterized protein YndB with AHSA1/START domain